MKRILTVLLSVLLIFTLIGCSQNGSVVSSGISKDDNQSEAVSSNTLSKNPLSGEYDLSPSAEGKRPIGIMINNIKASLPQRGISQADLYYEVLAEGGITRILAMFADYTKVPDTGSVRSARHYFLRLAQGHNAIFMHFGGSPLALQTIKEEGIKTINCLKTNASYRDKSRIGKMAYEHTAFTNADLIAGAIKRGKIETSGTTPVAFRFGDASDTLSGGQAATQVTVPFSSSTKATFTYDTEKGVYLKGEFDKDQIDGTTGKTLEVKNVFVLKTYISKLANSDNNSRIDVDLNSGSGYYISDGKIIPIKWKKGASENIMKYTIDGLVELTVNPGKSWVCIISDKNTVSYQ